MSVKEKESEDEPDTRSRLLDATEQLMLDEGYAGVSSRKVTEKAGIKSKLLHHYFRTMDDLFIAAFQRRENWHVARFAAAASSSTPLRDLWALMIDSASSRLILEYNALACHRPVVREVIARSAARDHLAVAAALTSIFSRYGIDNALYPPRVAAMTMASVARSMAIDAALGTRDLHPDTLEFIDRLMARFEPIPSRQKRREKPAAPAVAEAAAF